MKGEFCRAMTRDNLELQGLLVCPEGGFAATSVLHIHGMAGNFYENRFIDRVADAVARQGVNFLTVNTRGRDYLADFIYEKADGTTEYKQIGEIHEVFEESILDIEAWVEFLAGKGTEKVILQGHSHGALKATYYLFKVDDPKVAGLILLSPSDDFGIQRSRVGEEFEAVLKLAERLIAEGKGADLMPGEWFSYPISARTYMDIFGPDSHVGMFNLSRTDRSEFAELASITVPVLAVVGSVEEMFLGMPEDYLEDIRGLCKNAASFDGYVIEGAPHNYLHFEAQVAQRIEAWVGA